MKRKLSVITCSALFAATSLAAYDWSHTPADPDKYPFEMYKKEVRAGKNVTTLYDGAIIKDQSVDVKTVYHSPYSAKGFNLGEKATKEHLKAWDTDVRPDGKGLPEGSMTVADGYEVYAEKCGTCHGEFGEAVDKFPVLAGGLGTLDLHPNSGGEPGPLKTLGSYLPYIAPMYWYIQTAMPLSAPKSLTNDEVYGILGYLLQVNEIRVNGEDIEDDTVIDAAFIKSVHLPNEKGFEYNNLRVADTKNTRCMTNCVDKIKVDRVNPEATVVEPEFGEERYFYGEIKKEEHGGPGAAAYETYCAGCHHDGIAGAPKVGVHEDWADIIAVGLETTLKNAIEGKGAMPPKGGAMNLSDEEIKQIVEYMISKSK
jgi:cytochrome c